MFLVQTNDYWNTHMYIPTDQSRWQLQGHQSDCTLTANYHYVLENITTSWRAERFIRVRRLRKDNSSDIPRQPWVLEAVELLATLKNQGRNFFVIFLLANMPWIGSWLLDNIRRVRRFCSKITLFENNFVRIRFSCKTVEVFFHKEKIFGTKLT
jgi:hypothetical protein